MTWNSCPPLRLPFPHLSSALVQVKKSTKVKKAKEDTAAAPLGEEAPPAPPPQKTHEEIVAEHLELLYGTPMNTGPNPFPPLGIADLFCDRFPAQCSLPITRLSQGSAHLVVPTTHPDNALPQCLPDAWPQ